MMWAKRVLIGSGLAVASVMMVPAVSGAATNCVQTESMQEPTCVVVPAVNSSTGTVTPAASGGGKSTDPTTGTTSLPFTGADVEELAVVGAGAVLAGGLLLRRRRRTA
jgi:LPXTG-motif cell wall-anchored protein